MLLHTFKLFSRYVGLSDFFSMILWNLTFFFRISLNSDLFPKMTHFRLQSFSSFIPESMNIVVRDLSTVSRHCIIYLNSLIDVYFYLYLLNKMVSLFQRNAKSNNYYEKMHGIHGPVFKSHLFGKPLARVYGENLVGSLLVKDFSNFGGAWMTSVKKLMGPSALINTPVEVSITCTM